VRWDGGVQCLLIGQTFYSTLSRLSVLSRVGTDVVYAKLSNLVFIKFESVLNYNYFFFQVLRVETILNEHRAVLYKMPRCMALVLKLLNWVEFHPHPCRMP
jgi:hypothetical protein